MGKGWGGEGLTAPTPNPVSVPGTRLQRSEPHPLLLFQRGEHGHLGRLELPVGRRQKYRLTRRAWGASPRIGWGDTAPAQHLERLSRRVGSVGGAGSRVRARNVAGGAAGEDAGCDAAGGGGDGGSGDGADGFGGEAGRGGGGARAERGRDGAGLGGRACDVAIGQERDGGACGEGALEEGAG
eukprot:scaffold194_cov119-Isochrysis_galbana.AAC.5